MLINTDSVVPHFQILHYNCFSIAYTSRKLHTHKQVIEQQILSHQQTIHLMSFSIGKHVLIITSSPLIRSDLLHQYYIHILKASTKNARFR